MTNPVKTILVGTYKFWDAVLYQVGNAYYKVKPATSNSSTTRKMSSSSSSSRPWGSERG